jgi:ribose/xylose/arabinose/galactoside ABC-type transport system permease subunit
MSDLQTSADTRRGGLRTLLTRITRKGGTEGGLLIAIIVVIALTALLDNRHNYVRRPVDSVVDVMRQTSLLGIFALGSGIVIIAGGIDLSSGSVIAFGGVTCGAIMLLLSPTHEVYNVGWGIIIVGILGTLLVGLLIGSLHAWLITVIGLPPFVATLATLVGLRSLGRALVELITAQLSEGIKASQIQVPDPLFRSLATNVWVLVAVFGVLIVVCWVLMSKTVVGRHLHALGGNEQAARLSGIRTDRLKWLAYCISAMLSALAGIFYIADQSVADPQSLGRGYELNSIAAAVVGGCSLLGGVGTVPGIALGALFLRTVIDGVAKVIKVNADVYEGLIVGSVVVLAVAFNQFRLAGRRGKPFFAGGLGVVTIINLSLLVGALAILFGQPARGGTAQRMWLLGLTGGGGTFVFLLLVRFFGARRALQLIQPTRTGASKTRSQPPFFG